MDTQEKLLLTIKDAAILCSVNHQTIRKWIQTKVLMAFQIDKVVRIKKTDLMAFIEKGMCYVEHGAVNEGSK
jgi:excisionase family DNA binding protein